MGSSTQMHKNQGGSMSNQEGKLNFNAIEQVITSINTVHNPEKIKQKVCVHWLKNNCHKGDSCEYLHRYV